VLLLVPSRGRLYGQGCLDRNKLALDVVGLRESAFWSGGIDGSTEVRLAALEDVDAAVFTTSGRMIVKRWGTRCV
jgi:hypothetical protein